MTLPSPRCHITNKYRYRKKMAKKVAKVRGKGWRAYKCPHCSMWHLTSRSRSERKRYSRAVNGQVVERRD